jgi:hypothetical protein
LRLLRPEALGKRLHGLRLSLLAADREKVPAIERQQIELATAQRLGARRAF